VQAKRCHPQLRLVTARQLVGARRSRELGEEHPDTLRSANNLARSLSNQGKYAEAERIHREVLGARRRVLGEEHPDTLKSACNLASSLSGQEKHAEAERIHREVLGVERRVLGEEHPETLKSASNLAQSLSEQGKYAEAEEIGSKSNFGSAPAGHQPCCHTPARYWLRGTASRATFQVLANRLFKDYGCFKQARSVPSESE
jgi:hypothetical protein